jgi:hypothetical protein
LGRGACCVHDLAPTLIQCCFCFYNKLQVTYSLECSAISAIMDTLLSDMGKLHIHVVAPSEAPASATGFEPETFRSAGRRSRQSS